MIICEKRFDTPDPQNKKYSLLEVDFYAWIPPNRFVSNHRLSLRKNLETGKFEVYRYYGSGEEEVIFEGDFINALRFANKEYYRFHKDKYEDKPCDHSKVLDLFCPVFGKERRA